MLSELVKTANSVKDDGLDPVIRDLNLLYETCGFDEALEAAKIIEAFRCEVLTLQREAAHWRELYEAGCKSWDPVYKVILEERDQLRARVEKLKRR